MKHDSVWTKFKITFPLFSDRAMAWFPNGKDSIRVRFEDNQDYIFTYREDGAWSIETVEHFISRLKGDQKM